MDGKKKLKVLKMGYISGDTTFKDSEQYIDGVLIFDGENYTEAYKDAQIEIERINEENK